MKEFTLRELDNGIINGCCWPVDDPKKVVCIIHGIGEYGGRYNRVATRFNEAGYQVYSMDLRGHGRSAGKRGDCAPREEVLEDISTLLSYAGRNHPGKKIILYGHSLGGNIVLDYRIRGAFRDMPAAYLISAPWIRLARPIPGYFYRMVRIVAGILPTLTIGSTVEEGKLGNPRNVMPYREDPLIHNRISLRCALEGFEKGRELEDPAIQCPAPVSECSGPMKKDAVKDIPMMIMHGLSDQICDIEGSRAFLEKCRQRGEKAELIEFEGICHEIHNGGPESMGEEVLDRMIEFFDKC